MTTDTPTDSPPKPNWYVRNLHRLMLAALPAGILLAYLTPSLVPPLALIGDCFLRLLRLLVLPVLVFSIVAGITQLKAHEQLGRLSLFTVLYYSVTTALAVALGLLLVIAIAPGASAPLANAIPEATGSPENSLLAVLHNLLPTNIVAAASEGNVLGCIGFSVFLGIGLLALDHPAAPAIRSAVEGFFELTLWMVDQVMLLAPVGITGLVAGLLLDLRQNDTLTLLSGELISYTLTVLAGLTIHGLVVLPLLLFLSGGNPLRFFKAMAPALATSFSTASSSATLPITLESLEKRAGIPNRFAGFVAPLGSTINMDGTAIYEAVAALFIANMYGISLSFPQQAMIFLTATFSAVGAAGIPGAGLVMMTMILDSVGLPAAGISLIVVVDRLLDMVRTSVNVWGDSIGAAILSRLLGPAAKD